MATSLALQLKNLSTAQTSILDHSKKKASVLFDSSQAASLSREEIFDIGYSGFVELTQINDTFSKFKKLLFDKKGQNIQRVIQTKEFNEALDLQIEEFLIYLQPYFEKSSALKALEWLIHRFMINEMNVDSLLLCILPFYETNLFVRVLQIISLDESKSSWGWLSSYKKEGVTLPKRTVLMRWASDQWFRNFIFKSFLKILKTNPNGDLRVAVNFLITTTVGGIYSIPQLSENHLSSISSTVMFCSKSDNEELLSGIYLLLIHLSIKEKLSDYFIKKVLKVLCQNIPSNLYEECGLCLLNLSCHQNIPSIPQKTLNAIRSNKVMVDYIASLAREKTVSPFFAPFVHGIIEGIFSEECSLSSKEKCEEFKFIVDLINSTPFSSVDACKVISSFCDVMLENSSVINKMTNLPVGDAILEFEKSHPEGFDEAEAKILKLCASLKSRKKSLKLKIKMKDVKALEMPADHSPSKPSKELKFSKPLFLARLQQLDERLQYEENLQHKPFWQIDLHTNVKLREFLLDFFDLLSSVILVKKKTTREDFVQFIIKDLFKAHLKTLKRQIYFLSLIWGYHPELQHKGRSVSPYLKIFALNLGSSLLKASQQFPSFLLDPKESFFVTLLVPLCQGVEELSILCISVIKVLLSAPGSMIINYGLSELLGHLLKYQNEVSHDVSFLPFIFCNFFTKMSEDKNKVMQSILDLICNEKVSIHLKVTLLYSLSSLEDKKILAHLEPVGTALLDRADALKKDQMLSPLESLFLYYILLRLASFDVSYLERKVGRDLFFRCLKRPKAIMQVTGQQFSPLDLVVSGNLLKQISDPAMMLEILHVLLTQAVTSKDPQEADNLRKWLKKIPLEASLIIQLIENFKLIPKVSSVKEARASKIKRKKNADIINETGWQKLGLMVELIGVMNQVNEPWLLLGPLCTHLKETFSMDASFCDTLQQQMLSLVYHLAQLASQTLPKDKFLEIIKLDVVVLVDCIRLSINPDTHRRALLILALAAEYYPDLVLHNILTIFTFMGSSLLKRDDSYSFQVIEQTITSIIPTLIKTEGSMPQTLLPKLSQVIQVFVDALPDLTVHRKLPLFLQLASTIGARQYLWIVAALVVDWVVSSKGDPQSRRFPDVKFILDLYSHFPILDQLFAVSEILKFVYEMPDDKEVYLRLDPKSRNPNTLIINVKTRTSGHLKHLKHGTLALISQLLSSDKFIQQVVEYTARNDNPEMKNIYESLLKTSLRYFEDISIKEKKNKDNIAAKFYAVMHKKTIEMINSINNLLPPKLLCQVVMQLISFEAPMIRLRSLELMALKLQKSANFFSDSDQEDLLPFIEKLPTIALNVDEAEETRQHAFYVLQLLVLFLQNQDYKEFFVPVLSSTALFIQQKDTPVKIQSSAILLIGECIWALKEAALPCLDAVMSVVLQVLESYPKDGIQQETALKLVATATALERVCKNLPSFLSKYLKRMLLLLCKLSCLLDSTSLKELSGISGCMTSIYGCIVTQIQQRILVPTINDVYLKLCKMNVEALPVLIEIINMFISQNPKDLDAAKNTFLSIFTSALDLKSTSQAADPSHLDKIEEKTIITLGNLLLKLTEEDNLSIYTSLSSWASEHSTDKPKRLLTFFRFSDHLARILKVLFIKAKLAAKVLPIAAEVMNRNNTFNHEDTIFGEDPEAEELTCELLNCIFDCLEKIFTYFANFSEEKFGLLKPLTDQLENMTGGEEVYSQRVTEHLRPCITQYAVALGDDSLWKELNRLVLLRVRTDEAPKIILAALDVFEGLVDGLGEDYLQPLLADIMTYITEIIEHDEADVEDRARNIFQKLESILGESLKMYVS